MRKTNKYQDESQLQLEFQSGYRGCPKKKEEFNSLAQSERESKSGTRETAQFIGLSKIKTIQPVQPKHLSKKSSEAKLKNACGDKKPSGLLFDNLITVEELAVVFGLAPQTIRNWVAQGKLPYVKIGKRNMFLTGSLQEWLNRKEVPQWQ